MTVEFRDGSSGRPAASAFSAKVIIPCRRARWRPSSSALTHTHWGGDAAAWRDLNRIQEIKDVLA